MGFCQTCNHPTSEQDGKVFIIIDDELGVRPQKCMLCTYNKAKESVRKDSIK